MKIELAAALFIGAAALAQPDQVNKRAGAMTGGKLKMAMVSMKCRTSDSPDATANAAAIQANLERHFYFIDQLATQGVEFVGFPETSINGYHFSSAMTWLKRDGAEVRALAKKAAEKRVYIGVGLAEEDPDGSRWSTQLVIGPDGAVAGWHRKRWLTKEAGFVKPGADHNVFPVKGLRMGISICADGTDFRYLKELADAGAQVVYGPHANTTGGTLAGWYNFRKRWAGPWDPAPTPSEAPGGGKAGMPAGGWMAGLKMHAALCNHAGLYNPAFQAPADPDSNAGWASGVWFIGADGATLAQTPSSADRNDSREDVRICDIPIP